MLPLDLFTWQSGCVDPHHVLASVVPLGPGHEGPLSYLDVSLYHPLRGWGLWQEGSPEIGPDSWESMYYCGGWKRSWEEGNPKVSVQEHRRWKSKRGQPETGLPPSWLFLWMDCRRSWIFRVCHWPVPLTIPNLQATPGKFQGYWSWLIASWPPSLYVFTLCNFIAPSHSDSGLAMRIAWPIRC